MAHLPERGLPRGRLLSISPQTAKSRGLEPWLVSETVGALLAHAKVLVEGDWAAPLAGSPVGKREFSASVMLTIDMREVSGLPEQPLSSLSRRDWLESLAKHAEIRAHIREFVAARLAQVTGMPSPKGAVRLEVVVHEDGPRILIDADAVVTLLESPLEVVDGDKSRDCGTA